LVKPGEIFAEKVVGKFSNSNDFLYEKGGLEKGL